MNFKKILIMFCCCLLKDYFQQMKKYIIRDSYFWQFSLNIILKDPS